MPGFYADCHARTGVGCAQRGGFFAAPSLKALKGLYVFLTGGSGASSYGFAPGRTVGGGAAGLGGGAAGLGGGAAGLAAAAARGGAAGVTWFEPCMRWGL